MVDVLDNKRAATRFRILVEIAERQPAVSQGEIADEVGVTSQAVSEYIRELDEIGYVEKQGRSRYQVTNEGVDWLFQMATDVRRYTDHVTEDILESMSEDAAIALEPITKGEVVTLTIENGVLHARPGEGGPAIGIATSDADENQEVGVSSFEGVIELDPGSVTVVQIPAVRNGGSNAVNIPKLQEQVDAVDIVLASGVEAIVSLRRANVEPVTIYATGAVAAEAAERGSDVLIVATVDLVGRVTDSLRDSDIPHEVREVSE